MKIGEIFYLPKSFSTLPKNKILFKIVHNTVVDVEILFANIVPSNLCLLVLIHICFDLSV